MDKLFNMKETENGDLTFDTSNNPLIDLNFSLDRESTFQEVLAFVRKSEKVDRLKTAASALLYRDCRNGKGERDIAFNIISAMDAKMLLPLIVEVGRWKDLLWFFEKREDWRPFIAEIIEKQLKEDIGSEHPSLLAKWMPSINSKSRHTRALALELFGYLSFAKEKDYRKTMSHLRKQIGIVETKITNGEWAEIEYSKVPSLAMNRYHHIFRQKDEERFLKFIEDVSLGKAKINNKLLNPCHFMDKVINYSGCWGEIKEDIDHDFINASWKTYIEGVDHDSNAICVVDVSGSMYGQPLNVAIGLGLYVASTTSGRFADKIITFSEHPRFHTIDRGESLTSTVQNILDMDWGMNTNIAKTFKIIAQACNNQKDVPERVIVISDMQFDSCVENGFNSLASGCQYFKDKNLEPPQLVFWNVNGRETFPMQEQEGVFFVNGYSEKILESVIDNKFLSAMDMLNDMLLPYEEMIKSLM